MTESPVEELTPEDVLRMLDTHQRFLIQFGVGDIPYDGFFVDGDLDDLRAAQAWWPEDVPFHMAMPTAMGLTTNYHKPELGATFKARLLERGRAMVAWLAEQGRSAQTPNKVKTTREQVRSANKVVRTAHKMEQERVSLLYREYMQICADRKASDATYAADAAAKLAEWSAAKNALTQVPSTSPELDTGPEPP